MVQMSHLLDHQIDHAPQIGILCLEKLGDTEEYLCSLFLHVNKTFLFQLVQSVRRISLNAIQEVICKYIWRECRPL